MRSCSFIHKETVYKSKPKRNSDSLCFFDSLSTSGWTNLLNSFRSLSILVRTPLDSTSACAALSRAFSSVMRGVDGAKSIIQRIKDKPFFETNEPRLLVCASSGASPKTSTLLSLVKMLWHKGTADSLCSSTTLCETTYWAKDIKRIEKQPGGFEEHTDFGYCS